MDYPERVNCTDFRLRACTVYVLWIQNITEIFNKTNHVCAFVLPNAVNKCLLLERYYFAKHSLGFFFFS